MKSPGNRILIIVPLLPDFAPYVYNYYRIVEDCGGEYDVVCWNRGGIEGLELPSNHIIYDQPTDNNFSPIRKLLEIYGFYRFVRRSVRGRKYQFVFIYTIADSIFFTPWLISRHNGRFIFDIRDYSPLIDHRMTRWFVCQLLSHSALNVISSEGFLRWLPKEYRYLICHNTSIDKARSFINYGLRRERDGVIHVMNIGALRDVESNLEVIKRLGNRDDIMLDFVGDGDAAPELKQYCWNHAVSNVAFYGRYKKEEEEQFVRQCDMMNVFLPADKKSAYLMSNRFYLSVCFRKPMIVNKGCFQADQVRKYGLGLVIENDEDMYAEVVRYWESIDWQKYNENCVRFLQDVCDELDRFRKEITQVVERAC